MNLLTYDEAAEIAGISCAALRLWIKRGVLATVRVPQSNYRRVLRADLERLLTPAIHSPPTSEEPSSAA